MPLIVGLGNPGPEYHHTPHNIGFDVLARLAERTNIRFSRSRAGKAEEAVIPGSPKIVLLRPLSFMNLSGLPVSAALHWHGFSKTDLLVICDDVNLPLGHLRMREKGGAGGQKGLKSIIESLGTDEIIRLRIGVGGGDPGANVARHVLAKFPMSLRAQVDEAVSQAVEAIECILHDGLPAAMNRYNTRKETNRNSPSGEDRSPDNASPKGDV